MVVTVVAVGAFTGTTLPARLDFTPLSQAQIDKRLSSGTVELLSLGCDLSLGQGTGVAVAGDTILTSRHVVAGFRSLDVIVDDHPARSVAVGDVSLSASIDTAVIRAPGVSVQPLSVMKSDPRPDERVWVAGFPREAQPTRTGLVVLPSTVIGYAGGRPLGQRGLVMRLRGTARPGMSGGPVLDQAGRLAGVVFGVDTSTNDTLAIPASVLGQRSPVPSDHPSC